MRKIIYLIAPVILTIFFYGCAGYEPIFRSINLQYEIADYSITGDSALGNKIYSKLYTLSKSKKNEQDKKDIAFSINVSKDKQVTSKDSAGKILEYKITLMTKVKITDFFTDEKILNQTFISSLTYKTQDQHSDTLKLENTTIQNLIDKTYQELLVRLSQSVKTK